MINKNVIALGFVSFFTDMASSMVTTILPIFVVYILNEGVDKLGFIVAITTIVSYGFRILFGYLSDRLQIVKPFVLSGYLISALTKPLLYFSSNWGSIAILRGAERVGKAVRSATKDRLISVYSNKQSGKTFGFHKMMDVAGELSGAIIAFLMLMFLGKNEAIFREIFSLTIIPGIISVVIIVFFVKDVPFKKKEITFNLKRDYHILKPLFIYFGFIFFMFNDSFFMIKAKESGYLLVYIPILVILLNLTQTLFSYFFGVKTDLLGARRVLLISFLFGIFSLICLYLNFIALGFVLLGIFTVSSLNAIRAFISEKACNKSTIYGLFYGGIAISSALGASFTGVIWSCCGENSAILISLLGTFLITVILKLKIF